MRKRWSMRTKLLVSVLIGAAFLAIALWGVEWQALGEALGRTDWTTLAVCLVVMMVAHGLRAHRWYVLVNAARPSPFRKIAAHAFVGYMAISRLPFRAGEFVRPFLLKTREGIPFSVGLATCIAERVFDILGLAMLLAIVLWAGLPADTIMLGSRELDLYLMSRIAFGVTLGGIGFIVALIVLRRTLTRVIEAALSRFSQGLAAKVSEILDAFVDGLAFLPNVGLTVYVTVNSLSIWLLTGLTMWGVCQALQLETVTIPAAMGVLAVTMVGTAIPAGPAFVGSFELFCTASLALYSVPQEEALAVAVLHHALGFFVTVSAGVLALGGVTGLLRIARQAETVASGPEADSA